MSTSHGLAGKSRSYEDRAARADILGLPPVPPAPTLVLAPDHDASGGSKSAPSTDASHPVTDAGTVMRSLTAKTRYRRKKLHFSTRLDDFISDAVSDRLQQARNAGHTQITKEDIVCLALIEGLNIDPPEGWELR